MSEPILLTEEQRELFRQVAAAVRSWPDAYREAGRWLDETVVAEVFERVQRGWLNEARHRREQSLEHGREFGRSWMVPPTIGRSNLGRERWRERRNMRNPSNWRIIDRAAHTLRSDPPNYDALRPDLSERMARRVLLVVWILTDPRDLATNPPIAKLQSWDWGEYHFDAVPVPARCDNSCDPPSGMGLRINRLYARIQILDKHLGHWEQMARKAMRFLQEMGLLLPSRTPDGSVNTEIPDAGPDKSDCHHGHAGARTPERQPRKEPKPEAIAAYRLWVASGATQSQLAEELTRRLRRPVNQGQVSRWIGQVRDWLKAGNILPELPGLTRAPAPIDPTHLDLGERTDSRTRRQRTRPR